MLTVQKFLQKLKIELPYNLTVPLLCIYPKEIKTYIQTKTYTLISIISLFIIAK